MGCCFSNNDDKSSQNGEVNEHTRLLASVNNNATQPRPMQNDEYGRAMSGSYNARVDEQSILNRILHQAAVNVIDVSALESNNLEQHEYQDRARQYAAKIVQNTTPSKAFPLRRPCLLTDIPAAEKALSIDLFSQGDISLIQSSTELARKALLEVVVEHKESLVVQFGIP